MRTALWLTVVWLAASVPVSLLVGAVIARGRGPRAGAATRVGAAALGLPRRDPQTA